MTRHLLKATIAFSAANAAVTTVAIFWGVCNSRDLGDRPLIGVVVCAFAAPAYLVWPAFSWMACHYDRLAMAWATFVLGLLVSAMSTCGLVCATFMDMNEYWPFMACAIPWIQAQTLAPVLGFIWGIIGLDAIERGA